jgi:hypothetical protein
MRAGCDFEHELAAGDGIRSPNEYRAVYSRLDQLRLKFVLRETSIQGVERGGDPWVVDLLQIPPVLIGIDDRHHSSFGLKFRIRSTRRYRAGYLNIPAQVIVNRRKLQTLRNEGELYEMKDFTARSSNSNACPSDFVYRRVRRRSPIVVTAAGIEIALGRVEAPADIAGFVSFLASSETSYMTGQSFVFDGGVVFR